MTLHCWVPDCLASLRRGCWAEGASREQDENVRVGMRHLCSTLCAYVDVATRFINLFSVVEPKRFRELCGPGHCIRLRSIHDALDMAKPSQVHAVMTAAIRECEVTRFVARRPRQSLCTLCPARWASSRGRVPTSAIGRCPAFSPHTCL